MGGRLWESGISVLLCFMLAPPDVNLQLSAVTAMPACHLLLSWTLTSPGTRSPKQTLHSISHQGHGASSQQ